MRSSIAAPLARTRFLAQQHALAVALGMVARTLHSAFKPRRRMPTRNDLAAVRRRFSELLDRDWDNTARGYYPRRLLFDLPVRENLRALPAVAADLPRVVRRVRREQIDDLPRGIDRGAYPSYYLRNFHWQTDGWLSEHSARVYDFGVDLLFGGSADVMRRMAIPPLVDAVRDLPRPRLLDVACGTGRFLAALRAALPQAHLTGIDLSPFYIERTAARAIPSVGLAVENAEALPYRDGWFDAVSILFLLHELPRDARRRVLAEARRVVKRGGVIVVLDSAQLIEAEELAFFLESFHRLYHEPYYKGYLADPVEHAMTDVGLTVESTLSCFVSKVVVGRC